MAEQGKKRAERPEQSGKHARGGEKTGKDKKEDDRTADGKQGGYGFRHAGGENAGKGKCLLRSACGKHGPIRLPHEQRENKCGKELCSEDGQRCLRRAEHAGGKRAGDIHGAYGIERGRKAGEATVRFAIRHVLLREPRAAGCARNERERKERRGIPALERAHLAHERGADEEGQERRQNGIPPEGIALPCGRHGIRVKGDEKRADERTGEQSKLSFHALFYAPASSDMVRERKAG